MEFKQTIKYLGLLALIPILVLYVIVPTGERLYLDTENRNFEKIREKSNLDCDKVPVHCAIRDDDRVEVQKRIASGVDLEATDNWGATALFWAAMHDKARFVQMLLINGANPNVKDDSGSVLLTRCVLSGKYEIAGLLLNHGANIEEKGGRDGLLLTPLQHAIKSGDIKAVEWLIKHGAKNPQG